MKTHFRLQATYKTLFLLMLSILLLAGCSGGGGNPIDPGQNQKPPENKPNVVIDPMDQVLYTPDPGQPKGGLNFHVKWPDQHSGQVIPQGTNRISIFITGEGIDPAIGVILNNTGGDTANVKVDVPSGKDRLVSVTAREVTNLPSDAPGVDLSPKYGDLLKGIVLASGSTDAFDLAKDEVKAITIVLKLPDKPTDPDPHIFRGGTQFDPSGFPTNVVYGSALDENGDPIMGLNMGNFRVYEQTEGWNHPRECVITDVRYVEDSGGLRAGSVVLCLDKSGSMYWYGGGIAELKAAANQFVDMMHADDQGEIINFSHDAYVSQPFTYDKALMHAAIDVDIGEDTALVDAVWQSINDASQQTGRKAALIMTDGNENASHHHTVEDVANLALTAGVPCYIIGLGDVNTYILEALATATGGTAWFTPDPDELEGIYKKIGVGLASQIRITYVSCDPFDYDPDKNRHVFVYLTNYPPITDDGDILAFEETYAF